MSLLAPLHRMAELRKSARAFRRRGFDYRSRWTFLGLPILAVTKGIDPLTDRPRVARGWIAVGDRAVGLIAVGGMAAGGFVLAGVGVGLVAVAGIAAGGVAVGGVSAGVVAVGGAAAGKVVVAPSRTRRSLGDRSSLRR